MKMSNDEIFTSYLMSNTPHREMIQILAETNDCTEREIIDLLMGRQKKTAISKISTATTDFTAVRGRIRYLLEQRKLIDDDLAEIKAQMHELLKEMEG